MSNTSSIVRVTRHAEFEMAHILEGYNGGCGNLHGHSYKIEVTVEGAPDLPYGFVLDFKKLDKIIKFVVPDHMFAASEESLQSGNGPEHDIIQVLQRYGLAYKVFPSTTSAESMVRYLAADIQSALPVGLTVCEVRLWETTNSYATWVKVN